MDILPTHNPLRPAIARTISHLNSARQDKFVRDSPYIPNSRKDSSPSLSPHNPSQGSSRIPKTTRKPLAPTSEQAFKSTQRNHNNSTHTEKPYSSHKKILISDERVNTLSSKGKIFPIKNKYIESCMSNTGNLNRQKSGEGKGGEGKGSGVE
jgi:hypothetical protein